MDRRALHAPSIARMHECIDLALLHVATPIPPFQRTSMESIGRPLPLPAHQRVQLPPHDMEATRVTTLDNLRLSFLAREKKLPSV